MGKLWSSACLHDPPTGLPENYTQESGVLSTFPCSSVLGKRKGQGSKEYRFWNQTNQRFHLRAVISHCVPFANLFHCVYPNFSYLEEKGKFIICIICMD